MILPAMREAQRQMLDLAARGWRPGEDEVDELERKQELFETLFNRFKRGEDVP